MAGPDQSVDGANLQQSIDALRETVASLADSMGRSLAMQGTFGGGPHEREAARRALAGSSNPTAGMTTAGTLAYASRGGYEARQVAGNWLADRIGGSTTIPSGPPVGSPGGGGGPSPMGRHERPNPGQPPGGGPPVGQPTTGGIRGATARAIREVSGAPSMRAAASSLPGVGAILGMVKFAQEQRDANAAFQSVEGGTDNIHGFGERFNEGMTSLTNIGMFSAQDTSTLYRGATSLGLTDRSDGKFQSRQGALDFGYEAKSSMGMGPEESLKFLQSATRSTALSFDSLSLSLEKISKTAGQAGVNAELMRSKFDQMFNTGISQGLSGTGANNVARASTNYQASLGRLQQSADVSGRSGSGFMYMAAGRSGMTINTLAAMDSLDPMGAARVRGKQDSAALETWLTNEYKDWILKEVDKYGGKEVVKNNPGAAEAMFDQFRMTFKNANYEAMQSVINGLTGQDLSPTQAFSWIVQQVIGNTEESQVAADQAKMKITSGGFKNAAEEDSVRTSMGKSGFLGSAGNSDAANVYLDSVNSKGQRDPMMEMLFKGLDEKNIDQNTQQVIVQTAQGPRKISLLEAMKGGFQNQIASGIARFEGGAYGGSDISAITGMADATRKQAGYAEAGSAAKDIGTAWNEISQSSGSGGIIDLSDDAKQWFKMIPQSPNFSGTPASGGSVQSGRSAPAWTFGN